MKLTTANMSLTIVREGISCPVLADFHTAHDTGHETQTRSFLSFASVETLPWIIQAIPGIAKTVNGN